VILSIWEGTSHRQMLDGLEVMERNQAHTLLLERLAADGTSRPLQEIQSLVEYHLALPQEEKEANAEKFFSRLAALVAHALSRRPWK